MKARKKRVMVETKCTVCGFRQRGYVKKGGWRKCLFCNSKYRAKGKKIVQKGEL